MREDFYDEDILFMDQRENALTSETIGDNTFFNVHSAFMARTYIERPNAQFITTKFSPSASYQVDNLNAVLNKDMDDESIEVIRYQKDHDKYKYGVGCVLKT